MSYRTNPGTECCPGNVNRFMPNFILHMWEREENEIHCNLYGASIYQNNGVEITEKTNYPFEESISFTIKTPKAFDLKLRIPQWAKAVNLRLNGEEQKICLRDGYALLQITEDCSVTLNIETKIEKVSTYDGVFFRKGILVYALGGNERREIDRSEKKSSSEFPAYNMYPDFEWRYCVENTCLPKFVSGTGDYFSEKCNMPQLILPMQHLPDWDYVCFDQFQRCTNLYKKTIEDMVGNVKFTPPLPSDTLTSAPLENITLYPYGCCKLRITVFPETKQDVGAKKEKTFEKRRL